ncbi:MAG: Abi family protein [Thermoguttaceae bacterium]
MSQPSSPRLPRYAKPWLSYPDQVARLITRGLSVPDEAVAERFLAHVNYYRLSGYCLAFEQQRRTFLPGVTFDDVAGAYAFDVVLRDLLTEALEVIEIDVRACLAYSFGQGHGAFGHADAANFFRRFDHADWIQHVRTEVDRSTERFIEHFRATYADYPDLPIWVLSEVMSFGTLTRMYRGMERADQRAIARRYGLQNADFGSILLHMAYVRNLCAHHSRIWDRAWSVKPTLPHGPMWRAPTMPGNDRLFCTLCLIQLLLNRCPAVAGFAVQWRDRLLQRLVKLPNTPQALARMGMPANWIQHPVWK